VHGTAFEEDGRREDKEGGRREEGLRPPGPGQVIEPTTPSARKLIFSSQTS
jgi:hypothetical protein